MVKLKNWQITLALSYNAVLVRFISKFGYIIQRRWLFGWYVIQIRASLDQISSFLRNINMAEFPLSFIVLIFILFIFFYN